MTATARELAEYMRSQRIISAHNHHRGDADFAGMDLQRLISWTYVNWVNPFPDITDREACAAYIRRYATNCSFRWFAAAMRDIYGLPFTAENLPELDARVRRAYADPAWHIRLLRENCRFDRVVNDKQDDPGSDLGHPELFAPSFRCDGFFSGYVKDKPEPNNVFIWNYLPGEPETLEEYLNMIPEVIAGKKRAGCAALKVAIAYERGLDFAPPDYALAAEAFGNKSPAPPALKAFGDAVMLAVCEGARASGLPLQVHTGMGGLEKANPAQLLWLIKNNPGVTFLLLHGGFPWLDDTLGLVRGFRNIVSDVCWIAYLSSSAAEDYLVRLLETADSHRVLWGCDTWMPEDSRGALLAFERVLPAALERLMSAGATDAEGARYIIDRILRENARELFRL